MGNENAENGTGLKPSSFNVLAGLSVTVLLVGLLLAKSELVSPGVVSCLIALAAVLGTLILVGAIESFMSRYLTHFYGFRYVCLALFTTVIYVARINGLNDLNAVFHIDPGALPLTTWVATILATFKLLQPAFLVGLVISVYLSLDRAKGWSGEYDETDWIRWVVCSFALGIFLIIGLARSGDDARMQLLYRVSQSSDFVSKFRCENIESQDLVGLFIGPDQKRVLIAPAIRDSDFFNRDVPQLFKPVKIPNEFPILDCIAPSIDMERWRRDYVDQ